MIGERIKAIRLSQTPKLSQKEFGDRLKLSRDTINNLENGRIDKPSGAIIQLICKQYGINPLYLSGESDLMRIPPDEDEELIDRALENADPMMKALLLGIVKKPDGWRMLAESILTAADTLRDAGFDADEKKPAD